MSDPKARVTGIISAALLESGAHPWPKYLHDLVSDRLDSEGLLRKAPDTSRILENLKDDPWVLQLVDAWDGRVTPDQVVPSERDINRIYTVAFNKGKTGKQHSAGIQAIRNHLLTLGYKDPS